MSRGCSSAGRAPRSHRGGRGFESPHLHRGRQGEEIACTFLRKRGFEIIARNLTIKWQGKKRGEIDIIAKKKGIYHFVEVKTSLHKKEGLEPENRATKNKLNRVFKTAMFWLISRDKNLNKTAWQIDVIAIDLASGRIDFYEDVFEDPGL